MLRRGGSVLLFPSALQLSPSALAIEDEKVSPVEILGSGNDPGAETLWNEGVGWRAAALTGGG